MNLATKLAIERYVQYMQMHRRSIATLAEYSRGTNKLVSGLSDLFKKKYVDQTRS